MALEGYLPVYDDESLEKLLANAPDCSEDNLYEDKMIKSDDWNNGENFQGACMNWELRGKGYSLDKKDSYSIGNPDYMSDEELLLDAMNQMTKGDSYNKL